MKYTIILVIATLILGTITTVNAQSKTMDQFTLQVDGLGCPFCAYGLEKKFKELKGIKEMKIEMETGVLKFEYPSTNKLSVEQAEKQVEKAGYTPVSVAIKRADGTMESSKQNSKESDVKDSLNTISFFVAGNCDMCKSRIENAAIKIDGVQQAVWNKETKQLTTQATAAISKKDIKTVIAKTGHDTKDIKATKKAYDKLPGCCQYIKE